MSLSASAKIVGNKNVVTSVFGRTAKAGKVFYGNALAVLEGVGKFLVPAIGTAGGVCVGVVDLDDKDSVDTTGTTDGDVPIKVRTGIFPFRVGTSTDALLKADEGNDVFVIDDETVGKTDGAVGRPIAGQLWKIDTVTFPGNTVAWVSIGGPRLSNVGSAVGRGSFEVITAAGALSVATEISQLNLPTGAMALTLANGTAKGQRKVITIGTVAGSPNATVTPATAIGFTTISAFGALGDCAELIWNGAGWLIVSNFGVTVA